MSKPSSVSQMHAPAGGQRRAHRAEPVAFLDAQTRRAADTALALRRRHRHSQSRNDVGNLRTICVKPMQFRCAGDQLFALPPDVRAHVAQNADQCAVALCAVRVKPRQANLSPPNRARDQIKRRVAPVAADVHRAGRYRRCPPGISRLCPFSSHSLTT